MSKNNILFIGYVMPSDSKDYGFSIAGNLMQLNIIKALDKKFDIDLLCIPQMASYPKNKMFFVKRKKIFILDIFETTYVRFINIPIFKQLCQIIDLFLLIKKSLNKKEYLKIICFNNNIQTSFPIRIIQKLYKAKIIVILADPPVNDSLAHKICNKLCNNMLKDYDKYILLNEYCVSYFNLNKPYLIIDGGVEIGKITDDTEYRIDNKNLLYTGALTYYSGIETLIDAAISLKEKGVKLIICGKGELSESIKKISSEEKNIIFLGSISHTEVLQLQKQCFLLVNPRKTEDEIAKLTFPSKTFEYLLSGRPILSTKLNCYGKEYEDKMFFVKSCKKELFIEKITEILNLDVEYLQLLGKLNVDWVKKEKNWDVQGDKIVRFVND